MFSRATRLRQLLALAWLLSTVAAAEPVSFNRDIRPLLSENCFYCHGQDGKQREGDLRLDIRAAAIEAGALVPGDAAASELVARITAHGADDRMPPPDSNRRLADAQIKLLERWIDEGAEYEDHWAFVGPDRPEPPTVSDASWARNPIDQFVLAKLDEVGGEPSPEAERTTLIKRLSVDLTGLPPSPEEVAAFVGDQDAMAYERLVERLLASPHYGERMALPWLDAARYADSNGFQQDGDTWQWMWRDWVVRALNEDLPFDQFTLWQLAGDLLPDPTTDQLVASGFNRNHLLNGEGGAIAEEQRFVNLFDRVDTTSTTWLGLTVACAQCHDHKYDPVTQRDYYSMLDAFNHVPESGVPQRQSARIRVATPFLELPTEENLARIREFDSQIEALTEQVKPTIDAAFAGWREGISADGVPGDAGELPESVLAVLAIPEPERSDDEKRALEVGLRTHFDEKVREGLPQSITGAEQIEALRNERDAYQGDQVPRPMVMSDAQPRDTHILDRGEYLSPTEKVSFATPAFLPPQEEGAPRNRLGLARWLVAPEHPLTARVQVNRMWQHFFGTGIVKTAEDFGVQSEYPLHLDLLDWLAVEFRERGWSQKAMHRLIVTSATYRQSSRVGEWHRSHDAENRYLARASRFRMPAMLLRDWALQSSGLLVETMGGAPVYPYQPDNVWEALAITKERDFTYPRSSGDDLYRRSLYTFWRRTVGPTNMFDASDRQACRVRKASTSTPLHALTTLNDPTWVEAARVLAQRGIRHAPETAAQIAHAFERVLCRAPSGSERERLLGAYGRQLAFFEADPESAGQFLSTGDSVRDGSLDTPHHAALAAVCLAVLNLDEALTRE